MSPERGVVTVLAGHEFIVRAESSWRFRGGLSMGRLVVTWPLGELLVDARRRELEFSLSAPFRAVGRPVRLRASDVVVARRGVYGTLIFELRNGTRIRLVALRPQKVERVLGLAGFQKEP
jgi:hypothetical protein